MAGPLPRRTLAPLPFGTHTHGQGVECGRVAADGEVAYCLGGSANQQPGLRRKAAAQLRRQTREDPPAIDPRTSDVALGKSRRQGMSE